MGSGASSNGVPFIESLRPPAAISGGDFELRGSSLTSNDGVNPVVRFGETPGRLVVGGASRVVVRVPEEAEDGLDVGDAVRDGDSEDPAPVRPAGPAEGRQRSRGGAQRDDAVRVEPGILDDVGEGRVADSLREGNLGARHNRQAVPAPDEAASDGRGGVDGQR